MIKKKKKKDGKTYTLVPALSIFCRKLMKAKEKLRDLQGLIAAIESMPEGEKFADVSQNSCVGQRPARGQQAMLMEATATEEGGREGGNAAVSEGEVPPGVTADSPG